MNVRQVMTNEPACCTPGTKVIDAALLMSDYDCGAIPVVEDGRPVGIVTDRDIALRSVARGMNPIAEHVRDIMTTHVWCVGPDEPVDEAVRVMQEHRVRRLPVIDANGRIVGLVAQADLGRVLPSPQSGDLLFEISQPAASHAHRVLV